MFHHFDRGLESSHPYLEEKSGQYKIQYIFNTGDATNYRSSHKWTNLSTGSAMQLLTTPENEYLLKHVIRHSCKAMSFRRNLPLNVSPSFQKHSSN